MEELVGLVEADFHVFIKPLTVRTLICLPCADEETTSETHTVCERERKRDKERESEREGEGDKGERKLKEALTVWA